MATSTRPGVGGALRELFLGSEARLALAIATVVIGAGAAFVVALLLQPANRTFTAIVAPVQLIMSVLTPFSTAALVFDLREDRHPLSALRPRWIAAGIYGLLVGVLGAAVTVLALAVLGTQASGGAWADAVPAAVGSLLVQLIPAGVGCAAGLLMPRLWLSCLATIVVPLGFTLAVGLLAPRGTADWLTPLGAAGHLVPGPMTTVNWAQWVVVVGLWVALGNAIGYRRWAGRAA